MAGFGYSIGDFFTVVKFAWDTYEACRNSTSAFKDLGRDVGNAHLILRNVHNFWQSEKDHDRDLLPLQQDDLKELAGYCEGALRDVDDVRKKHGGLDKGGSAKARIKYVWDDWMHDFASMRERLQKYTGNLAIFHTALTSQAIKESSNDQLDLLKELKEQADIMKIFVVGYQELQEGKSKRVEPAWSQAAKLTDQDPKHTFQAAEKDLRAEGIDDAAIRRHYGLIEEWLQTVVLAPTNDPDIDESKSEFGSTLAVEDEVADGITAENSALVSKNSLLTGQRKSSKSREQDSKSHEQPHEEGSSTLFEGEDASGASVRDNMPVVRSDSLSTRRSQSSQWEPPDVDDVTDYAAKMLAKVLRSKYSPQDGEAAFDLPIKRAFQHLDWVSRGWLSRKQVEDQCCAAASEVKWVVQASDMTQIVRFEDEKQTSPDNRIDVKELTNIILTIRQEIFDTLIRDSAASGLLQASNWQLKSWYSQDKDHRMLSSYWSQQYRRIELPPSLNTRFRKDYRHFTVYSHEFTGDLPESDVPLVRNFTTLLYLATIHCTSQINNALQEWRHFLKGLSKEERDEYLEALNTVLDTASRFHKLDNRLQLGPFHQLDRLLEDAALVPFGCFPDISSNPVDLIRDFHQLSWLSLEHMLGFVYDLSSTSKIGLIQSPAISIGEWRRLRMLDRARKISELTSAWEPMIQVAKEGCVWDDANQSLYDHSNDCVRQARALRKKQEEMTELAGIWWIHVDDVKIDKVPSKLFKRPTTFFRVQVDEEEEWNSSVVFDDSSPHWTIDSTINMSVKRDSIVRLNFYIYFNRVEQNSTPLGFVEFKVREVADFDRYATVNLRRPLQDRSSIVGKVPMVTLSVTAREPGKYRLHSASRSESRGLKELRRRETLPLAFYIIAHPIPKGWEARRESDGRVYFFNIETSEPTAALWRDPLHASVPGGELVPVPWDWSRVAMDGQIWYRPLLASMGKETQSLPKFEEIALFEQVLEPIKYTNPEDFQGPQAKV